MISGSELRKGVTVEIDNQLYQVIDYRHIKIGRGSAQVRVKLRDIRGGHTIERSFQASEKFPQARLSRRSVQYLYNDSELYYFMDLENYEQIVLNQAQLGDAIGYLKEEFLLQMLLYGDEPIGAELPPSVELQITETDPGYKGDTATGGNKPATLETGIVVQVPLFINVGDVIKVDTRTGEYLERIS